MKSRPIIASHQAKCFMKGYYINVVQVGYANSREINATLENLHIVQEFLDVFPKYISGLPPKRDIEFTSELISGAALVSRAPYHMSILELNK